MAKPHTLRDIIADWLKQQGFDGLYDDPLRGRGCGCGLGDDFMPCDGDTAWYCRPGYKGPATDGNDGTIGPAKLTAPTGAKRGGGF